MGVPMVIIVVMMVLAGAQLWSMEYLRRAARRVAMAVSMIMIMMVIL